MKVSKKDFNEIVNTLNSKFRDYNLIDYDYIVNFVQRLINGQKNIDGIEIDISDFVNDMNPSLYLSFKVQNYFYYKLCQLSSNDADVLLSLVEDKRRIAIMVLKKLGQDDFSKIEDYLIEVFSLFDCSENFDSFITRFIMAKVKNVEFVLNKHQIKVPEIDEVQPKNAKKKKRKKKNEVVKSVIDKGSTNIDFGISSMFNDAMQNESEEINGMENGLPSTQLNPFLECLELCGDKKNVGKADCLAKLGQKMQIIDVIDTMTSVLYEKYLLLRFGYINGSFYSRNDIASILGIEIAKVLEFERITWDIIRSILNSQFDGYEKHILCKRSGKAD